MKKYYFLSSFLVTPFLSLWAINLEKISFLVSLYKSLANLSDGLAHFAIQERIVSTSAVNLCCKGSYDPRTEVYPNLTGLVCSERTTLYTAKFFLPCLESLITNMLGV